MLYKKHCVRLIAKEPHAIKLLLSYNVVTLFLRAACKSACVFKRVHTHTHQPTSSLCLQIDSVLSKMDSHEITNYKNAQKQTLLAGTVCAIWNMKETNTRILALADTKEGRPQSSVNLYENILEQSAQHRKLNSLFQHQISNLHNLMN